MYEVWRVNFRINIDKRAPWELFRTEPLLSGSVGDADPFSEAFNRAMVLNECSLASLSSPYNDTCTNTEATSRIPSLASSLRDSPFTPNTEASLFLAGEDQESASGQCLLQAATSPFAFYNEENDAYVNPYAHESEQSPSSLEEWIASPPVEEQFESSSAKGRSPRAAITLPSSQQDLGPACKTSENFTSTPRRKGDGKGHRKNPLSTTHRPPAKSRKQHLLDNKVAAFKCRQQKKETENQLKGFSIVLQASIKKSRSEVNTLTSELTSLKQQIRDCPRCRGRYLCISGKQCRTLLSEQGLSWADASEQLGGNVEAEAQPPKGDAPLPALQSSRYFQVALALC